MKDNLTTKVSDETQSPAFLVAAVSGSNFNISCQNCGKDCQVYKQVNTSMMSEHLEMWCYCEECDVETFHD